MMDKEEFIKYVGKINERIREKLKDDGVALEFYLSLVVCFNRICDKSQKQKEIIDKLNFIKNRKNQGASQENINKMAIEFVNSYLNEVLE